MTATPFPIRLRVLGRRIAVVSLISLMVSLAATAEDKKDKKHFQPENLVVSRSVYDNNAGNVAIGAKLPPNCPATAKCPKGSASADGTYPTVWNNDQYDGSFGITSKIFLDQITRTGTFIDTLEVEAHTWV